MLGRSILSLQSKDEGRQFRAMGVSSAVEHIFNETAMQARTRASKRLAKGNHIKSWSKNEPSITGKGKKKENSEKPKGKSKETKGAIQGSKGSGNGKTSKTGISGLENLKSETSSKTQESVQMGQVCTTETSWIHDEWSLDEWNDGWRLDKWNDDWSGVGWHEDCEQTYNTSASSFSFVSSERVNTNLDTGASVNMFQVNFDREGIGDGSFYVWIPDGEAWQFQGYDENGLPKILEWKIHGCTSNVVQHSISTSTSIRSCRDRVQRTTRFPCGTQQGLHDSDSQ